MNDEELVNECLRKYGTNEDAWDCIRHCGADATLQKALRELGAGEELDKALREGDALETQRKARHVLRKFAVDEAMEKARQTKATLDSIESSPALKDPEFWARFRREEAAKAELEKKKDQVKHYIDSAGQPARASNISKMGNPKRGADGQVLRDVNGRVIWEPNAEQRVLNVQRNIKSVTADGKINPNKSMMGHPKLGLDGHVTWIVNDEPKPQPVNVKADGKIDPKKSLIGTPKRNADGSISWLVN